MRVARIVPGSPVDPGLTAAVLARDIRVADERWSKGRRLSGADLRALAAQPTGGDGGPVTVLVPDANEVHEDDAGIRLAEAVRQGDPALSLRGPSQSRVDLVASVAGVVEIRLAGLERLNRLDPLEVFTVFDGQAVSPGDLVASVKVGPHLVDGSVLAKGEDVARGTGPIVRVRPFRLGLPVAVLVRESIEGAARERFERAVREKVGGLGLRLLAIQYLPDSVAEVTSALRDVTRGRTRAAIVLTAGGGSTDPADPFFQAVDALGGRVVRHGVPAHPGSMVWLARVGRAAVVGLPSCGAFSKATAADLLLPRLAAGQPASAATVARLGHGGILNRHQRFRFPAYARDLEAPDG